MNTAIVLPPLGTGTDPIRISGWLVEVGEQVEIGERVVEVLIEGMTFDVSAHATGLISRIEKRADALISIGDTLGWIQEKPV